MDEAGNKRYVVYTKKIIGVACMEEYVPFFRRQEEAAGEVPTTFSYELSNEIRNAAVLLWANTSWHNVDIIRHELLLLLGRDSLSGMGDTDYDMKYFILKDKTKYVLSALEMQCILIFRNNKFHHTLNKLFRFHRIGYRFCEKAKCILRLEDETFYAEVIQSSLGVLGAGPYADARNHYLESYKKLSAQDFSGALMEIGKAIESLLKTRFTSMGITFGDRDQLKNLLDIAQRHCATPLHSFHHFKEVILDAGRARNQGGHGHATGATPQFHETFVRFVINQGAANLLFLAEIPLAPSPTTP